MHHTSLRLVPYKCMLHAHFIHYSCIKNLKDTSQIIHTFLTNTKFISILLVNFSLAKWRERGSCYEDLKCNAFIYKYATIPLKSIKCKLRAWFWNPDNSKNCDVCHLRFKVFEVGSKFNRGQTVMCYFDFLINLVLKLSLYLIMFHSWPTK